LRHNNWHSLMVQHLAIGLILIAVAVGMMFAGRPDRNGVSPRFMRHPLAFALYPATALTFVAAGMAELIVALLAHGG
jgi:hypothetical protein